MKNFKNDDIFSELALIDPERYSYIEVPAVNFIGTVLANIDNEKLSDAEFRQFIRNSLPIVQKPELKEEEFYGIPGLYEEMKKYYKL